MSVTPNLNIIATPTNPVDFNSIRVAFVREIQKVTGLDNQHVIVEEPETQREDRPTKPYMSMKITTPGAKNGDDSQDQTFDGPTSSTIWTTGGQRKMTVEFNCYGRTHEESYNYMALWQVALENQSVQQDLRANGIAVWVIGNLADLSKLLNTGFEGRSHLESTFGIAVNYSTDLGQMASVQVDGAVQTPDSTIEIELDLSP